MQLLYCGAEYFSTLLQEIDLARQEIYLETYIFASDDTGKQVQHALVRAVARGVKVRVIIDWVGSGDRQADVLAAQLSAAGVDCRCFNPWFKRGLARTHRKIATIDQRIALLGGLNIIDDLVSDDGSGERLEFPRWDFAVAVRGRLVQQIHADAVTQWLRVGHLDLKQRLQLLRDQHQQHRQALNHKSAQNDPVVAAYVVRDNLRNRATIQRAYLHALGNAKQSAILANPYFAPGRKFRRALIEAASRGIDVTLLLGVGQFRLQDAVAHAFYPKLLKHGVKIVEYRKTQLHGKVAVIDDTWATVGSSNMDGLSLFMNHEANVIIKDHAFVQNLRQHLALGIADGVPIALNEVDHHPWYKRLWYGTAYLLYRVVMRIVTLGAYS